MSDIRVLSLYSGSTGNAFLVCAGEDCILIDAGKNAKQLCLSLNAAGVSPDRVQAIFLTHEHNDHTAALSVFLKKHPIPVHLPAGCVYKLCHDPAIEPRLCPHPPIHTEQIGCMRVTSFPTPHDSRASVGYRIEIQTKDPSVVYRIGYATDIGYVSRDVEAGLLGCDAVVLESNHDVDMLMCGIYPEYLKQRIFSRRGHLSNPDSAVFAARLCQCGTKSLMLAHLSQENNTPDIAYDECVSAVADSGVPICVAAPDHITEMILPKKEKL
ncbi:MAG: MBL fold metallo-hydrolase [Clostridia bacterium]|nr:MBL fold metallo-hydrolase [Clostridia bacterium]